MFDFNLLLCAIMLISVFCISAVSPEPANKINAPGTYKILNDEKTPIRIPFTMLHNKPVMEARIIGKPAFLTIYLLPHYVLDKYL